MEIQVYSGKCKCNKDLDMRIIDTREVEKDTKSKAVAWIIYGFCRKCEIVYFQGLFPQEEKPILNRDFMVDYNKKVQTSQKRGK